MPFLECSQDPEVTLRVCTHVSEHLPITRRELLEKLRSLQPQPFFDGWGMAQVMTSTAKTRAFNSEVTRKRQLLSFPGPLVRRGLPGLLRALLLGLLPCGQGLPRKGEVRLASRSAGRRRSARSHGLDRNTHRSGSRSYCHRRHRSRHRSDRLRGDRLSSHSYRSRHRLSHGRCGGKCGTTARHGGHRLPRDGLYGHRSCSYGLSHRSDSRGATATGWA